MLSGCAFVVWFCCGIRNNCTVTFWNLDCCGEFVGLLSYRGDSVKSGWCSGGLGQCPFSCLLGSLLSHCIPADAQWNF